MSLTQKWLRNAVGSYEHAEHVYADVDNTLQQFPTLRPKSDVYTWDDGRTQLLLCVHGVLPIQFRNASYHIPVAVWLTRPYPSEPPIPYVVPTQDMLIKAGPHLDLSGRCSIDYLDQWRRKSESCSLSGLLEAMQALFSRDPPVYSKPKQQQQPQHQLHQPPHLPPKPSPPTYAPPRPPSSVSPPVPPPPPPPPHFVPSPPQIPQSVPPPPPPPQFIPSPPPNLLDEDPVPIVAPAPAPPRPPNPELVRLHDQVHAKLTSELNSLHQALTLDAERLRAHQADLLAGEPAIRDEMARLEAVRDVCRTVAVRYRDTVNLTEKNISDLRRKGDPEVDELVCSTTIVHNQLINLVAEDNAIEDTIYHLHRALSTGRIDLERFLRTTRVLAEEQFMKRALIEKIKASLPIGSSSWAA
ncbi:Suppressor protein stp22 of temperature-sensitive alpha-factor receptor and arginine permease [Stygiomarasmius scandens]|uniref:Suppressor protein stp22 of temperature-sensitive alpha-factor receptor and arginine permease n=1 Tax=Marasmiellus scandens TaxID=2682957 RepID=A0ABR1JTC0_9AGAR